MIYDHFQGFLVNRMSCAIPTARFLVVQADVVCRVNIPLLLVAVPLCGVRRHNPAAVRAYQFADEHLVLAVIVALNYLASIIAVDLLYGFSQCLSDNRFMGVVYPYPLAWVAPDFLFTAV
jgi:hypothetical protein